MLQRLPETGAVRERRLGWMAPSVAIHAAIITAVAFAPAKGREAPPRDVPPDSVFYVAPATDQHVRTSTEATGSTRGPLPRLPIPDQTSTSIADPTTPTIWSPIDNAVGAEDIATSGPGDALSSGASGTISEATVDEPVRVRTESAPLYPMQLRAMGIQGAVDLEFVVDTTGRADPATLHVISSSHDRFTAAVRAALEDARFVPGRYNGHAVRTLVRRRFEFRLEGTR